ncbi:hypothetical protein BV898_05614 [Hypsibius exemplaris]|uniref:G-protein coupled receptors family 1 profile domain-containing protein n=1 Tax=Hypsibius exemplaris TaxID=2072580 RepID=A0A1W0WYN6_HYPEX|nr:hypothetical protein BV898_05614 [Hypsibius exemplaris]
MDSANNSSIFYAVIPPIISGGVLPVWFGIVIAFVAVGGLNNGLLLYIIAQHRRLYSGTGFLISHMVFLQFLHCSALQLTHCLSSYLKSGNGLFMPRHFCRSFMWLYLTVLYAVNWSGAFIAISRFVAIHRYGLLLWNATQLRGTALG